MCDISLVYWYSSLGRHLCSYCKNKDGFIFHRMSVKALTVEDYQNLFDRGWSRWGNYFHKPLMDQICCPRYTIKCDALNFQLSKSQKKVIKKFNKFLRDGVLSKSTSEHENSDNVSGFVYRDAPVHLTSDIETQSDEGASHLETIACNSGATVEQPGPKIEKAQPKSGIGADPNKPPCKQAKILRMERRNDKLLKRGMSLDKHGVKNQQKSLEEFLNEDSTGNKHKLKLELYNTANCTPEWEELKKLEFALYRKYQIAVHNAPPETCKMEDFLNFLVNSPLEHVKFSTDSDLGFGSFHQLYWLDDKLIAVGVIDILPKCISAEYFFYDPDYRVLALGTYGTLREVEFVRLLHQKIPSIQHYSMGPYIHSSPKMRYKGKPCPSYLLCPETYRWVPIDKCVRKLDVSKYSRLEENEAAVDEDACTAEDVDNMKILISEGLVLFKQYKRRYGGQELFDTIGNLIGQKCSKSIIIFIGDQ